MSRILVAEDNPITAFHPGAMMRSYENHVRDVKDVGFGIVGPDGYEAMLQNSTEFAELGIQSWKERRWVDVPEIF